MEEEERGDVKRCDTGKILLICLFSCVGYRVECFKPSGFETVRVRLPTY